MSARPPILAGILLRALLSTDAQEALVGDMREHYERLASTQGRPRAWLWYWRETLSAVFTFGGARPQATRLPGDPYVRSFFSDLRTGIRTLLRAPLSSSLSVLTLALGIGAIGAVFSVVNPILLRPLPYPHGEQLVFVWQLDQNRQTSNLGFATFADLRAGVSSVRESAVLGGWDPTLIGERDAERVTGQRVSWNYFRVLGVHPALGRDFVESEDVPGQRVVMLSNAIWKRRFGSDSSIVGRTINIDGVQHLVAGVMGPEYENVASSNAQIWRTLTYQSQAWACRTCQHLRMVARLPEHITAATAESQLNAASAELVKKFPDQYSAPGMLVTSFKARMTAPYKDALLVLFAAASLLALIAIANVVSLQLGRAMQRESALAVRMMLGASRARIMRLLFAEGLILALVSGLAGVGLAAVFTPLFASRLPAGIPRLSTISVDASTVGLLVVLSVVVAIAVTLIPALRMTNKRVGGALRLAQRVVGHGNAMIRRSLVVAEVALALMLLVGAGLLSRTMDALLAVDSGIEPAHLLTMEIQATGARYATKEALWTNHQQVIDAVRAVPGVKAVGLASQLPLAGNFDAFGIRAFDKPLANPEFAPSADRYTVSGEFLSAMGIRVLKGRTFTPADNRSDAASVALVSHALADHIWPGEDPIGKRIQLGEPTTPWREVVGVVGDVHHRSLQDPAAYQFYVPEQQWPIVDNLVSLAVRTSGDPAALSQAIQNAVRGVDATQPIMRVLPMSQVIDASVGQRRLAFTLFSVFAALAVLLAAAGVYGVLATAVTARTREIGVRAALGATPGRLIGLVARDSAWLVGAGTIAGLIGVVALSRFLRTLLFGVEPNDPLTIVIVTGSVCVASMFAAVFPAIRAARTDPLTVLRGD